MESEATQLQLMRKELDEAFLCMLTFAEKLQEAHILAQAAFSLHLQPEKQEVARRMWKNSEKVDADAPCECVICKEMRGEKAEKE